MSPPPSSPSSTPGPAAAGKDTCAFCHKRRGKRACPALAGVICTACCGQHRLKEISCPADCAHLGGLATAAVPATQAAFLLVLPRLMRYLEAERKPHLREAMAALQAQGALRALGDWAESLVVAHLCYGHRGADGQRLLDRFLAERGRALPADEVAALQALAEAGLRLCEVRAVTSGALLFMEDLLSGEDLLVQELPAHYQLRPGALLCGWLVKLDGALRLTGAGVTVPESQRQPLLALLRGEAEKAAQRAPATPVHQRLNESTGALLQLLAPALQGSA